MDDDLFTYEVEIANIPCDLRVDDDSEHEADDMGFDPSDIAFTEWLGSKFFNYKTMDHYTMKGIRVLLVDPDLLTKDIMGFKTYDDYKDDWIYEWNKDVPWVDEKPWTDTRVWTDRSQSYILASLSIIKPGLRVVRSFEDSELKDEALRNKAIMEGFIKDDDDESMEELCEVFMSPSMHDTMIRGWIKYSFGQGEEYIAIKEDEYDNLARTSNNACRTYQEIFRMMDE
ncbi:hypothetical protein Tco_0883983 [Tanacetum coccineum]